MNARLIVEWALCTIALCLCWYGIELLIYGARTFSLVNIIVCICVGFRAALVHEEGDY